MHALGQELFPVCRSLTGEGVRITLRRLADYVDGLVVKQVPSGEKVFDWTVPDEWRISSGRLTGPDGKTVVDFADNNLHVVGYSEPVDVELDLEDLQPHLHSLPDQPDAIPYVTSYYRRRWGFCLTDTRRRELLPGRYHASIDSALFPGHLDYGEAVIPGKTSDEIFLSTYVCHPSMANNELSGPLVAAWLHQWARQRQMRHTLRFVFLPETIGSIAYLARNLAAMRRNVVAGFVLTCLGDDRAYSYLASREANTLADRAARNVLSHIDPDYHHWSFLDRGSDERQYCAPGIDLPFVSIMRSKYATYPEYHTSLDDFSLVTPSGLAGGLYAVTRAVEAVEENRRWRATVLCEPQLGRRGLYPTLSTKGSGDTIRPMMNFLAYADGKYDLIAIADKIGVPVWELAPIAAMLERQGLVENVDQAGESPIAC